MSGKRRKLPVLCLPHQRRQTPQNPHKRSRCQTMKSTKRKHPPDASDFEDATPQLASLRLRSQELPRLCSVKCLRVTPIDEIVPKSDSEPKQKRSSRTWRPFKQRLRDAVGLLRALFFGNFDDERVCLRLRGFLQFKQWTVS